MIFRKLLILNANKNIIPIISSRYMSRFHEDHKKGGYHGEDPLRHNINTIKKEIKDFPGEIVKYKDEMVRRIKDDEVFDWQHGDYEYLTRFNSKAAIEAWNVTSDKDFNEGNSTCEFVLNENKNGEFRGIVDTTLPKDGFTKETGYCNISSNKNKKSFKRDESHDWIRYTHLVFRIRGDGRPYQINLGQNRYYDLNWHDQYNFPLFTRGGPYWQIAKIPFSKFYLGSKGRIQDRQEKLDRSTVSFLGITLADGYSGPFSLEIDYIALLYDESHKEEFAYEMYEVPAYMTY